MGDEFWVILSQKYEKPGVIINFTLQQIENFLQKLVKKFPAHNLKCQNLQEF
jgi:hypothetical protein